MACRRLREDCFIGTLISLARIFPQDLSDSAPYAGSKSGFAQLMHISASRSFQSANQFPFMKQAVYFKNKPAFNNRKNKFSEKNYRGNAFATPTAGKTIPEPFGFPRNSVFMRIGFMRLIDAAPLVVAAAHGYFEHEGIAVDIERQGGWMIVRDKLSYGLLDASHSLLGMSIMSQLGRSDFLEPMVAVMNLGSGGSTLVVSTELAELGVDSPQALRRVIDSRRMGRKIICAHVSMFSMHHYLLRDWLARGEIDPDHDIQLVQLKPILLADHMSKHYVDLFCVGEPWGSLAESRGWGRIALATTDIYPDHPEKVLLTTESCARQKPDQLTRIIRALIRGCAYCQMPEHRPALAELLSQPEYVDESQELIMHSLEADHLGLEHVQRHRGMDWHFRSWQLQHCTPSVEHVRWFLQQMIRWRHLSLDADIAAIAARCVRTDFFEHATAGLQAAAAAP